MYCIERKKNKKWLFFILIDKFKISEIITASGIGIIALGVLVLFMDRFFVDVKEG